MKILYNTDDVAAHEPLTIKQKASDKKLISVGLIWNGLQLVINQSFAFIVKLILVKLLLPNEFGLIGMAVVFTGIVQVINDLGVGAALVQRKEADLREAHFQTAFWTGVIWSVALYAIMSLIVGPLASMFYHEPKLQTIIPVLGLGILFSPGNIIHKAQLTRQMNFKKIAIIDNTSTIVSGTIAIALAFAGAGVWALVFNSVATIFIAMPFFYYTTKWTPKFTWDKQAFKDVFGFGVYTASANLLTFFYNNIDYLLIGKLLGATTLGVYTLAFVLTDTFRSRIMAVVNNVMYPVYGKKQQDGVALKRYYLKVVQLNCLVIYPIMLFFLILGRPFITQIFGAKWEGAVFPLQLLSVSVMFQMMVSGNTALIRGLGKPGLDMKLQIVKAVIFLPTLAYGTIYYGMVGASVAILINKIFLVVIAQYTFKYLLPIKVSATELFKSLRPCLIATAVSAAIALSLHFAGVHYIVSGLGLIASYFAIIWWLMGAEFKLLVKQLKK